MFCFGVPLKTIPRLKRRPSQDSRHALRKEMPCLSRSESRLHHFGTVSSWPEVFGDASPLHAWEPLHPIVITSDHSGSIMNHEGPQLSHGSHCYGLD